MHKIKTKKYFVIRWKPPYNNIDRIFEDDYFPGINGASSNAKKHGQLYACDLLTPKSVCLEEAIKITEHLKNQLKLEQALSLSNTSDTPTNFRSEPYINFNDNSFNTLEDSDDHEQEQSQNTINSASNISSSSSVSLSLPISVDSALEKRTLKPTQLFNIAQISHCVMSHIASRNSERYQILETPNNRVMSCASNKSSSSSKSSIGSISLNSTTENLIRGYVRKFVSEIFGNVPEREFVFPTARTLPYTTRIIDLSKSIVNSNENFVEIDDYSIKAIEVQRVLAKTKEWRHSIVKLLPIFFTDNEINTCTLTGQVNLETEPLPQTRLDVFETIICTFYGVSESDVRPKITKVLYDKKDSSHKRRFRHKIARRQIQQFSSNTAHQTETDESEIAELSNIEAVVPTALFSPSNV